MLEQKWSNKQWFKDSDITVKQFLDYVLLHDGDFIIKEKTIRKTNDLFEITGKIFYLTDRKYSYKLSNIEQEYLAERNEYFKSKLA